MLRETTPTSPTEQEILSNMEKLRANPYPGRGIVMGINKDGTQAVQVYWVMGRSENSRNRILVREGDLIKTKPFDDSKVQDPSLIIYTAMREVKGIHIVSNGDQTDTVAEAISEGLSFQEGLMQRAYEPDAPNFTPRITGIHFKNTRFFTFSIIRRNPDGSSEPIRSLYRPEQIRGIGNCFHTYKGDGSPLPSFDGEPYPVFLDGALDGIANTYWELLNQANRVALVAKSIDLSTGRTDYSIINQLNK